MEIHMMNIVLPVEEQKKLRIKIHIYVYLYKQEICIFIMNHLINRRN